MFLNDFTKLFSIWSKNNNSKMKIFSTISISNRNRLHDECGWSARAVKSLCPMLSRARYPVSSMWIRFNTASDNVIKIFKVRNILSTHPMYFIYFFINCLSSNLLSLNMLFEEIRWIQVFLKYMFNSMLKYSFRS